MLIISENLIWKCIINFTRNVARRIKMLRITTNPIITIRLLVILTKLFTLDMVRHIVSSQLCYFLIFRTIIRTLKFAVQCIAD